MVSNKGHALALLCILALALRRVDAVFFPQATVPECTHCYRLPKQAANCGVPPDGYYVVNHRMPLGPDCDVSYAARSYFYFKHEYENVFSASGTMTTFDASLIGTKVPLSLSGMFDYNDCTFSGSYYSLGVQMYSAFSWVYDKVSHSFSGTSVNAIKTKNIVGNVMFGDVTYEMVTPTKRPPWSELESASDLPATYVQS